ncbi:hypothetical protein [Bosea sp. BH3]|uniref:hypothetical protein n=1 Tax=Bosea sp. BH3 TaxID=2871701 RepID=UPI0021CAF024|nr:hypothetical protein [Bosea sp. BH3]MCU4182633.1 hypothetical protein [Bosea sp. BH3]
MLNRVLQSIAVVLSVLIVLYFDLVTVIRAQVPTAYQGYFEPKTVFPLASGLAYLALIVIFFAISAIPPIRRLFDPHYAYVGHYIGRPRGDDDQVNVFSITVSRISFRYLLSGDSFRLSTGECIGGWHSEFIHFGDEGVIKYAYTGRLRSSTTQAAGDTFAGEGYARLTFYNEDRDQGFGYWVDDRAGGLDQRVSDYYRVSGTLRAALLSKMPFWQRQMAWLKWPRRAILTAYDTYLRSGGRIGRRG